MLLSNMRAMDKKKSSVCQLCRNKYDSNVTGIGLLAEGEGEVSQARVMPETNKTGSR